MSLDLLRCRKYDSSSWYS